MGRDVPFILGNNSVLLIGVVQWLLFKGRIVACSEENIGRLEDDSFKSGIVL